MNSERKLKRGDVHPETGRVFWAYGSACLNGEYWVSKEGFAVLAEKASAHQRANRQARRESVRKYHAKNRERINAEKRIAREVNLNGQRDKERAYEARYKACGRRAAVIRNYRLRVLADPLHVLKNRVRSRLAFALTRRRYSKTSRTYELIGCGWAELKTHIESQFKPGMSWENRGEWHVDHIFPLASATTEAELRRLCHFSNLQPLWAAENIRKGDKLPIAA